MNAKWLSSKEKLLNYIGKKYTMSEAMSIKNGTKKLIGVAEPTKHNLSSCYTIIWGQLTLTLRNKLKAKTTIPVIEQSKDAPGLFKLITTICNRTSTINHEPTIIVTSMYTLSKLNGNRLQLSEYYKHFTERQKAAELCGFDTTCGKLEVIIKAQLPYTGTTNQEAAAYTAMIRMNQQEQFYRYTIMFMKQARDRFKECRRDINNDFTKGTGHIPETSIDYPYALLQNYEATKKGAKKYGNNSKGSYNNGDGGTKKSGHAFQQSSKKDFS
eukprot:jgi/Psemu1/19891/gm1.19891_g